MPAAAELERLRAEVRAADAAILKAIERRFLLAREIGEIKQGARLALRDFSVERAVVDRWRDGLEGWGVSSAHSEALARWIIGESLRLQEELPIENSPAPVSDCEVAIVGGAGAIGRWLGDFLEDGGHRVAVVDPRPDLRGRPRLPDVETAVRDAQVVVFSTPIRHTAPLLRRALSVRSDALLVDVLSVKAPIVPILQDAAKQGRRVSSLHPMFGPSAQTLSGRNLLIVSCGVPEADRAARSLFSSSALTITDVPLEHHDRLMADSLGLSHAVNLLFLGALAADPLTPHDLASAASTTFRKQAELAGAFAREGPELYLDIQAMNPYTWGTLDEIEDALDRLKTAIERHDVEAFRSLMDAGRAKLEIASPPIPVQTT